MPNYSEGSAQLVPMFDYPDRQRYAFWRPHATPIQASLLRLTGWLEEEADREVLVERGDGTLVTHSSEGKPLRALVTRSVAPADKVLFRLERPGTRERADWESYFIAVRKIQGHNRLVQQKIAEADRDLARNDARILELTQERDAKARAAEAEAAEFQERMRGLEKRARAALARGSKPSPTGPYRQLEAMRAEGSALSEKWAEARRGIAARFDALQKERVPIQQRREWYDLRVGRRVYPGLYGIVNAFLDVQALSAASIAVEEFRKTPRHDSAVIEEMEARLATD